MTDYYTNFYKLANSLETGLDVELGSGSMRGIADSVGMAGSVLNLLPVVVKNNLKSPYDEKLYRDLPSDANKYQILENDERGNLYKSLADMMYDADPESLSDTKVYLGGPAILDRLKRVWKNKRTGVLAKLFGTIGSPASSIVSALHRSDHYDPLSDSVALYSDNPAVLTHELGHAIDFNKLRNPAKDKDATTRIGKILKVLKNEVKAVPRDIYTFQKILTGKVAPYTTLYQETMANKRSLDTLNKMKEKNPELVDAIKRLRTMQLPAAWSTYATIGTGLFPSIPGALTAGGIRAAMSHSDQGSFDDIYGKLKDMLEDYKKKRKEGLDSLATGDVLNNPDKYDGSTSEYFKQRPDDNIRVYVPHVEFDDDVAPDTRKVMEYLARRQADYMTLKARGQDREAEKLREETMHTLPSQILGK